MSVDPLQRWAAERAHTAHADKSNPGGREVVGEATKMVNQSVLRVEAKDKINIEHDEPEDTETLVTRLITSFMPLESRRLSFGEVVASGGVGRIGLAKDNALGRQVAVKMLKKKSLAEPVLVKRFFREAQITAQLEHPNIVPIHELGVFKGIPYFTMSFVKGRSVKEWLEDVTLIDHKVLVDFLEIISKVCDALSLAHSRGVVHCDLKPANIMVGNFGQVYLMDWGRADLLEECEYSSKQVHNTLPELPNEGKVFGTPAYMAPERARGKRGDVRSDVFALGAILYEFVVGQPPFRADTAMESLLMAQVCAHTPMDENSHGEVLPRELYFVVKKAMACDPKDRYTSVAELKAGLTRIIRGGSSFSSIHVQKGQEVICEGDQGETAYIVIKGEFEVFRWVKGKRVVLRKLGRGEVFGEMAIFASAPRTASVVALTDATLLELTKDVIAGELDSMKPWMASFIRTLTERFIEREMDQVNAESPTLLGAMSWWSRK